MIDATVNRIKEEIKNDNIARSALVEDTRQLEKEVKKWEQELHRLQKEDPTNDKIPHIDCEGYRKFVENIKKKEALKRQIATDKERLRILRGDTFLYNQWKSRMEEESRTDIVEMNLDNLTQPEIIRILKQLERRKVEVTSKLRETENSLDYTAKIVNKLEESYKMYQTELDLRERKRGGTRQRL